jgi:predicted ester cyclase
MSQANKDLIVQANDELFNKGNIAFTDEAFAASGRRDEGQLPSGKIKELVEDTRRAFPDINVVVNHLVAEGDYVAWQRVSTGTHENEWRGIPASGKKVSWTTTVISRIVDGKITDEWGSSTMRGAVLDAQHTAE